MPTAGVTITATLVDLLGAANAGSILFTLDNYQNYPPEISGSYMLAPISQTAQANGSGVVSITLWGNYQIIPNGTFYVITVFSAAGSFIQSASYNLNSPGTFDLSTLTPSVPGMALPLSFADNEIPTGLGVGATILTLAHLPVPPTSVSLFRNGDLQEPGFDYFVSSSTVTMNTPLFGSDTILVNYRYGTAPLPIGTILRFADNEIPSGISVGATSLTLAQTPNPPPSVSLFRNGTLQQRGFDYTASGTTITLTSPIFIGDTFLASYRY